MPASTAVRRGGRISRVSALVAVHKPDACRLAASECRTCGRVCSASTERSLLILLSVMLNDATWPVAGAYTCTHTHTHTPIHLPVGGHLREHADRQGSGTGATSSAGLGETCNISLPELITNTITHRTYATPDSRLRRQPRRGWTHLEVRHLLHRQALGHGEYALVQPRVHLQQHHPVAVLRRQLLQLRVQAAARAAVGPVEVHLLTRGRAEPKLNVSGRRSTSVLV